MSDIVILTPATPVMFIRLVVRHFPVTDREEFSATLRTYEFLITLITHEAPDVPIDWVAFPFMLADHAKA